jgi:hypothetical protein
MAGDFLEALAQLTRGIPLLSLRELMRTHIAAGRSPPAFEPAKAHH